MSYFYRNSCSGDYKTWILLRPPRLSHNTLAAYTNIIHRCYSTVYDIRISLLLRPFFACFYQTLCSLYSRILTLLYRNHFAFASQQQQGLADPRVEITGTRVLENPPFGVKSKASSHVGNQNCRDQRLGHNMAP